MTIVDTLTGEITEPLTEHEAKSLTHRIRLRAEAIAESVDTLVSLIDKAQKGDAASALGYPSWTAYVAAEFADVMPRLGKAERQELVGRLSERGMSTRAIAPVVGVHHDTVAQDIKRAPVGFPTGAPRPVTPSPPPAPPRYEPSGMDEFAPSEPEPEPGSPPPTPITGRDGKTYQRPAPNPIAEAQAAVKSQPAMLGGKAIERLDLFTKTVDAAGGPNAIAADADDDPDLAPVWLPILDRAAEAIDAWRAAIRRRNLRSVR